MIQPNEIETRTALFTWVQSHLPNIDLEQLQSKFKAST